MHQNQNQWMEAQLAQSPDREQSMINSILENNVPAASASSSSLRCTLLPHTIPPQLHQGEEQPCTWGGIQIPTVVQIIYAQLIELVKWSTFQYKEMLRLFEVKLQISVLLHNTVVRCTEHVLTNENKRCRHCYYTLLQRKCILLLETGLQTDTPVVLKNVN